MKTQLLKGSATYGAVTIISRIAAIITIPILTRLLSPDEYGTLNIMLTVVQLANFVATLEVAQAVTLFYSNKDLPERSRYPSTALFFSCSMYLLLFFIVVIFSNFFADLILDKTSDPDIVVYGVFLLAANGIFFLVQNQFRLTFQTKHYALFTLGYVLLTSIGAIVGALYFKLPAGGVLLSQAIGASIVNIFGIFFLKDLFNKGLHKQVLRRMLQFSLPLVPAGLLLLASQQIPKFILNRYSSLENVGVFGLAYQIAGFAGLAVLGVQTAITPAILANHQSPETPKMLGKLFETFVTVSLIFCTFLSLFAIELVSLFSSDEYASAASYVPFLSFSVAMSSLYIFFPGKIIKGKSAKQLLASASSFIVAVITGFFLVQYDGVRGAALSTLLSATAFFIIWFSISQQLYKVPVNWIKLAFALFITIIVCTSGMLLFPSGISFPIIALKGSIMVFFSILIARKYLLNFWYMIQTRWRH